MTGYAIRLGGLGWTGASGARGWSADPAAARRWDTMTEAVLSALSVPLGGGWRAVPVGPESGVRS